MKALKGTPEEKALLQRYTHQLDMQEDRLGVPAQPDGRPQGQAPAGRGPTRQDPHRDQLRRTFLMREGSPWSPQESGIGSRDGKGIRAMIELAEAETGSSQGIILAGSNDVLVLDDTPHSAPNELRGDHAAIARDWLAAPSCLQ